MPNSKRRAVSIGGISRFDAMPEEFENGWRPLFACIIGSACGIMAITFYTQSLFVGPVTESFGWGRGQFLLSYTILMLAGVITAPFVGSLIERTGPTKLAVFSLIGHAVGYCLLALTPGSLIAWYGTFAFLAVASAGTLPVTWMYVIHKWFSAHRGKAIGFTMAGTGAVAFVAPPLVEGAISTFGWRGAYAVTGLVPLIVSLPIVANFLRLPGTAKRAAPPSSSVGDLTTTHRRDRAPIREGAPEPIWGYSRAEALKSYKFWALGFALMLMGLAVAGLLPNFVSVLTDKGMPRGEAAQIAAVIGVAVLAGRILAGFLVDRFWAPAVAAGFILMPIVSISVLILLPMTSTTATVAAFTLGLALGAEIDLLAYVTGRYFGAKHFGPVFSLILVFFMLAAGLAPAAYGVIFDVTGSYSGILTASIVMLAVCVGLFLSLGRYPDFDSPRV